MNCEVFTRPDGSSINPEILREAIANYQEDEYHCGNVAVIDHAGIHWCDRCYDIWHDESGCTHVSVPVTSRDIAQIGSGE